MVRARQASEDFGNRRMQSIHVHNNLDVRKRQNLSADTLWFRRAVFNLARGDFSTQLSSEVLSTPRTKLQAALRAVRKAVRGLFLQSHVIQVWQKRMGEGHALKAVRRGVHDMSRQRQILNMWQDQVEEDDAKDVLLHQFKELSVALDQLKSTDLAESIQNVLNSIDPKLSSLERLGALATSHIQTLDDLAQLLGLQTSALQKLLSTWEWHLQQVQSSLHDQAEDIKPLKNSTTLWLSAVQQGLLKLSTTVSGTPATVDFQTKESVCSCQDQMEQETSIESNDPQRPPEEMEQETSIESSGPQITPHERIAAEDNVGSAIEALLAAWNCQARQEVIEGRQLPVTVHQQAAEKPLRLDSGVELGSDSAHADLDQVEERQSSTEEETCVGMDFNKSASLSPTGKGVALIPHSVHISFDHEEDRPSKPKEEKCFRTDSRSSARSSSVIKDRSDSTDPCSPVPCDPCSTVPCSRSTARFSQSDLMLPCSPAPLTPISGGGNDSDDIEMPVLCGSPFNISRSGASTPWKANLRIDGAEQCQMHQLAGPDTASETKAPKKLQQKRRPSSRFHAQEQALIKEEKWQQNQFERVVCKEGLAAAGAPPSGFSKASCNTKTATRSIKLPSIDPSNVVDPDVLSNFSMQQTCESFMATKSSITPTKPCEPQSTYCRPLAQYSKDHAPHSIEDLNPMQNKLLSAILEDDCSPVRLTQIVAEDMCLQHFQELPKCSRQHGSFSSHQVERIAVPQLLKRNPAPPISHLCRVSPRIHMQKTLSLKVPPALPSLTVRRKSC